MKKKHALDVQDARDVIRELQQEMLIDQDDEASQIDVQPETAQSEPASVHNNTGDERPVDDLSAPSAEASESSRHVENIASKKNHSVAKLSARSEKNRRSPRVSTHKRKARKTTHDRKNGSLPPESSPRKIELKANSPAQQRKTEEQVAPPDGIGGKRNHEKDGLDSPVTKRSISMAAARAAPGPDGWKPVDGPADPVALSGMSVKTVTGTPEHDSRKPAVKAVKRKGKSLRALFIVFLLAVGPLVAVVGVKFHDYVITISARVNEEGMIRGLMPSVVNARTAGSEVITDVIADKATPAMDR